MKKKIKWVVLAILIIGVLGTIFGGDSSDSGKETKEKTEQKEQKELTYGIGQTITVGDVEYTVNSMSSSKRIGNEYLYHDAQETYLIVNISIKNNEDEPLSVSDNFFILKNGNKEYSADTTGSMYLDENIIYENINPETTLTGNICFDVTQETIDNANLQLQVQTGSWGTEKGLINLH